VIEIVNRSSSVNIAILINSETMELGSGDEKSIGETTFCRSNEHNAEWDIRVVIAIFLLMIILPVLMFNIFAFSKKIQLFPLKARGPKLVLLQMIYFILLNIVPLAVEGLVSSDIDWKSGSHKYVSRSFFKALYFMIRWSVNFIYLHRTLLIYANWRIPLDSLYNKFWMIFGNELRSIIVGITDKAFLLFQALSLVALVLMSDVIVTGFSSLDIYKEGDATWYVVFNPTFFAVVECSLLMACYYALRFAAVTQTLS
jgi:hypothetical protein